MGETFCQSMTWLHTWAGLVLGTLLFAIFWMDTLSVFDREIDRWMMPQTRLASPTTVSLDRTLPAARAAAPDAPNWGFRLPTGREPVIRLYFQDASGAFTSRDIDPATGALLPAAGTLAGTGFIFPFHFRLHIAWQDLGYWLVVLAGMAMLVLLVSGVIVHRKRFAEFFTFRYARKLPRSSLDLHNLTGVIGLPFHFVMTLSGLIIFFSIYFPSVIDTVYSGDRQAFFNDAFGSYQREAAGEPGEMISLDPLINRAREHWPGETPHFIRLHHPGDENAWVEVRRDRQSRVTLSNDPLHFDAISGALLQDHESRPAMATQTFLTGLHLIQFHHWPLRWLYFVLGLSGCVMIATGYIYWLETRRKRHARLGLPGVRIVEGLTIGSVTGIIIATLTFFIANRLLPLGASFAGCERAALEVWAFYLVWLATFAHAWLRPGRAWREQCGAVAALALLAPALNWITTGDHLVKTIAESYWPVAGMDLLLLAGAVVAAVIARRLARQPATATTAGARDDKAITPQRA